MRDIRDLPLAALYELYNAWQDVVRIYRQHLPEDAAYAIGEARRLGHEIQRRICATRSDDPL